MKLNSTAAVTFWILWLFFALGCGPANVEETPVSQEVIGNSDSRVDSKKVDELIAGLNSSFVEEQKDATRFIYENKQVVEDAVVDETFVLVKIPSDQLSEESRSRLGGLLLALYITKGEKAIHIQRFVLSNYHLNTVSTSQVIMHVAKEGKEWDDLVTPICENRGSNPSLKLACSEYELGK